MPASEARILANQANAKLSTGPRTAEGKERSRANALKHGLTGAGVVLPEADAAEVERRAAAPGGDDETFRKTLASFFALERRAAALEARYLEPAPTPPSKAPGRFDLTNLTPIDDIFDVPIAIGRRR